MTTLTVRVWDRPADVPAVHWDDLTARPPASLVGSRSWIDAALATIDRGTVPVLLAIQAADRVVALMTLVLDERSGRPVLRFAASPFNDLTDLMTLPGYEAAAGVAAIDALLGLARNGWALQLDDIDPAGVLAGADRERRALAWKASFVAPTVDLRDPDARPSAGRRRCWDRSLRQLRASKRVEFGRRDGTAMVEAFDEFVRVRDMRLRALRRNLSDPPPTLLAAAVRGLAPLGRCAFMEMLVDGAVVARDLYLLDGAVAMLWLRALDMGWLRYSCGHLLLRASAELLAAEGYETLDLGRGGEPYKFAFGARERVLLSARMPDHGCARPHTAG